MLTTILATVATPLLILSQSALRSRLQKLPGAAAVWPARASIAFAASANDRGVTVKVAPS